MYLTSRSSSHFFFMKPSCSGEYLNFDRTLLLLELHLHRRNIDRRVCAETNAEYVLEIQDHGCERTLKTVRKMLRSASYCFRNFVIQLRFVSVTDFDILVVDVVTLAERKNRR